MPRPAWTKHKFRELDFTSNYFDNFSDLPVDVDGDGYPDIVARHLVREEDLLVEESRSCRQRASVGIPGGSDRAFVGVEPWP